MKSWYNGVGIGYKGVADLNEYFKKEGYRVERITGTQLHRVSLVNDGQEIALLQYGIDDIFLFHPAIDDLPQQQKQQVRNRLAEIRSLVGIVNRELEMVKSANSEPAKV